MNGYGTYFFYDFSIKKNDFTETFVGELENGKFLNGTYTFLSGRKYIGSFINN